MNIFFLSNDYTTAAEMHCDKHAVKMVLETAQMLSTAHRALDGDQYADKHSLCKIAHLNHPSTQWVRAGSENYKWAYGLFVALLNEHKKRYGTTHKYWSLVKPLKQLPRAIAKSNFKRPPQCMPDAYKHPNTVTAYRRYYQGEKAYFASWARAPKTPKWWQKAV